MWELGEVAVDSEVSGGLQGPCENGRGHWVGGRREGTEPSLLRTFVLGCSPSVEEPGRAGGGPPTKSSREKGSEMTASSRDHSLPPCQQQGFKGNDVIIFYKNRPRGPLH